MPRRSSAWIRPAVCLLAALLAIGRAAAASTEQALVEFVEQHTGEALELIEKSVNINSGTMNFAGVRQVGELLRPYFAALGFEVRWVDGAPFGRAGHLIAERAGTGPHVLLIGHLDTVFEPTSSFQRFERIDAQTARGPGIADMKGGNVIGLMALRALAAVDALDALQVTVVLHGDEEDAGAPLHLARQHLVEAAKSADIAIGLENADDDPTTAVIARRSSSSWQLRVHGRSAHSSQVFGEDVGAGAIYEIARILHGFYTELSGEANLTFNPGLIVGGAQTDFQDEPLRGRASGKTNIVAGTAIASGDLRALSVAQRERAKARMRQVVAAHLPHTSAQLMFEDSYPPMTPTAGNERLLALYDEVSRDLGFGPVTAVDPRKAGAADVSFAAAHVEMAIDGLGLLGGDSHTPREYADLRTLPLQTKRLAVLLYRLGRGAGT